MFYKTSIVLTTLAATAILLTGVISYSTGASMQILSGTHAGGRSALRLEQAHLVYLRTTMGRPRALPVFRRRAFLGIKLSRDDLPPGLRITVLHAPLWIPFLLASAYPTYAIIRVPFRQHYRRRHNCCIRCGYNLRGNVSGICPECGCPRNISLAGHLPPRSWEWGD